MTKQLRSSGRTLVTSHPLWTIKSLESMKMSRASALLLGRMARRQLAAQTMKSTILYSESMCVTLECNLQLVLKPFGMPPLA